MSRYLQEMRAVYSDAGERCMRDIDGIAAGDPELNLLRIQYGTELAVINRVIEAIDVRLGLTPPKPPT